jgi:PucR C-terminal helix-turn-helix domain
MIGRDRGAEFVAVLHEMASDSAILDEIVDAARAHSPVVARLPVAENRRHISVLLAAGLASFEGLGDPSERDFAEATRLGAERAAQGVPIGGLLCGVQAGRTRALEIAIERGRAAGIADDTLVQVLLDLDRYTGALERHVVSGYHAAERELARGNWEARTRALRRLLLGDGPEISPPELARLGLGGAGPYHCVVSDVTEVGSLRAMERGLTAHGGVSAMLDGRLSGLTPRLPAPGTLDPAALVVSSPAVPIEQAGEMYGLCLLALEAAGRSGKRGLHSVVDLAGEAALAAQPLLGRLLGAALLAELNPADDFHRELAGTALAYLDNGQRLDHAAAALHVHPNTVRYRLRRLREIAALPGLGAEPGERLTVLDSVRLWWALRDWLG